MCAFFCSAMLQSLRTSREVWSFLVDLVDLPFILGHIAHRPQYLQWGILYLCCMNPGIKPYFFHSLKNTVLPFPRFGCPTCESWSWFTGPTPWNTGDSALQRNCLLQHLCPLAIFLSGWVSGITFLASVLFL